VGTGRNHGPHRAALRFAISRLVTGPQVHYASEGGPGGETILFLPADAVAFLDAARIERAILVGHSGSCLTARRVAVNHPDRVAGLVLIGAPLSLAKPAVLTFQAAEHALEDPVPAQFVREFQAGAVHVPLPEGFLEGLVAASLKLPARVWKRALDGLVAFDDAADLGRITAPTLVIWGDHDTVVSRESSASRTRSRTPG
jgi:pimeloyl-ACP methyl ester carboxylesterase